MVTRRPKLWKPYEKSSRAFCSSTQVTWQPRKHAHGVSWASREVRLVSAEIIVALEHQSGSSFGLTLGSACSGVRYRSLAFSRLGWAVPAQGAVVWWTSSESERTHLEKDLSKAAPNSVLFSFEISQIIYFKSQNQPQIILCYLKSLAINATAITMSFC